MIKNPSQKNDSFIISFYVNNFNMIMKTLGKMNRKKTIQINEKSRIEKKIQVVSHSLNVYTAVFEAILVLFGFESKNFVCCALSSHAYFGVFELVVRRIETTSIILRTCVTLTSKFCFFARLNCYHVSQNEKW